MFIGKDNTYNEILKRLGDRIAQNKQADVSAILAALIELLDHLDKKEEKKYEPTFD